MKPHGDRRWTACGGRKSLDTRALVAWGLVLVLAACAPPSGNTGDVAGAGAAVERAAADIDVVARRARAFRGANNIERAAIEVDEAEVILRKAREDHRRIADAHRSALTRLAAARERAVAHQFDSSGEYDPDFFVGDLPDEGEAARRADRIGAALAAADRRVAAMERILTGLKGLDLPVRR